MIQRIKTWLANYKEKRKRRKILKIIKKAKQEYLKPESVCMCFCFYKVAPFRCYNDIVKVIPEYKPSTFGLVREETKGSWWPATDAKSRIKAFDKLIEIYSI